MSKEFLRRYELLIYFCIGLISAVLFFLGSYVVTTGTASGVILNLCSELLGVAIVFFIVNRMFPTDVGNNSDNSQLSKDIEKIRGSLDNMNQDIIKLSMKITSEIDKKQEKLLEVVGEKFSEETQKSHENLRKAIEEELRMSLSRSLDQSQTVERLVELIGHSIKTMGSFQRSAIEEESRKMFADLLQNINKPTENLSDDVKILQQQVQDVQKNITQIAISPRPVIRPK